MYCAILVRCLSNYSLGNDGDIFCGKQGLNTPKKIHIKTHMGMRCKIPQLKSLTGKRWNSIKTINPINLNIWQKYQ